MFKKLIILVLAAMAVYACTKNEATLTKNDASLKTYAQQITQAFQSSGNPVTHGHYYGKDMLNEMVGLRNATRINVINGVNEEGIVHILFKVTDQKGEVINKMESYDFANGWPPSSLSHSNSSNPDARVANIGGMLEDNVAQQWTDSFKNNYAGRPAVFSFEVSEIKKILSMPNAEGMFFAYGLVGNKEYMVAGAIDGEKNMFWDNYLSISKGEETNNFYSNQKITSKN